MNEAHHRRGHLGCQEGRSKELNGCESAYLRQAKRMNTSTSDSGLEPPAGSRRTARSPRDAARSSSSWRIRTSGRDQLCAGERETRDGQIGAWLKLLQMRE